MAEPAGYVYRIASNLHRRQLRVRRRLRPLREHPDLRSGDPAEGADPRLDLLAALATLTPGQREALVLVEMFGYDAETAGTILGIKAASVRVRLHRARLRLREVLGGNDV
jgi:RNA polymerase sigma-70 factor (ECF subfamily)